jgi:tetratricopeptide (TPR) repeat protein
MFDNEDENFERDISKDLEKFEKYLKGGNMQYLDVDRLEAIVDHYLISGQYNKALFCAEYALSLFSFEPIFKLRMAQALSATGKLKDALNVLAGIEQIIGEETEWLLTKASIFSQLKDSKRAIKFFEASLIKAEDEDKDEIFLDLAMEHENANDYKKAIDVLKRAMKHNPSNEGAIYELAYCYDQLNEHESAIKSYTDFIDENPYSYTSWYNLGNAYSKVENFDQAIWAYDYCLIINADFGPAHFNLGNAYLSIEKYKLAVESFEECMRLDGDDPVALCYIGEAYEQLEQLPLAKLHYQRSMELAPMLPDAWLGMGIVQDLEGNTFESLPFILKAIELDPDNASMYHVLAGAYEKLEEYVLAEENYKKALSIDESDVETLTNCMDMILETKPQEALAFINDFKKNYGENRYFTIILVNVLWKLGKKTESVYTFRSYFLEDSNTAKEIFEINEELKTVNAFTDLFDE